MCLYVSFLKPCTISNIGKCQYTSVPSSSMSLYIVVELCMHMCCLTPALTLIQSIRNEKEIFFQFQFAQYVCMTIHVCGVRTKRQRLYKLWMYLNTWTLTDWLTVAAHCISVFSNFDLHERENLRSLHYCWLVRAHRCDCLWHTFSWPFPLYFDQHLKIEWLLSHLNQKKKKKKEEDFP